MSDTVVDIDESEEDDTGYRLSRKVDVVGFFDVSKPKPMLEFWQMHTPPAVGDSVLFDEGTSVPEAVGKWEVVHRQWHCFDGPFTVIVYVKKID